MKNFFKYGCAIFLAPIFMVIAMVVVHDITSKVMQKLVWNSHNK